METMLWCFYTVCMWLSWNSFPECLSPSGSQGELVKGILLHIKRGKQAGAS